jgi:hypothetical protein
MKNRIWSFTLLVSLLLLAVLPVGAQPAPGVTTIPGPLTRPHILPTTTADPSPAMLIIRGRVVDALSQPQAGLLVQALLPSGRLVVQATTSADGRFVLANLPQPAWDQPLRLQALDSAQHILALSPTSQDKVSPAEEKAPAFHELVLAPTAQTARRPAPVSPSPAGIQATGQITGIVTAADTGLPLQFVYATAYTPDGGYIDSTLTDSTGQYTLTGLEPGDYKIEFYYYGGNYIPEWYDDRPDLYNADLVTVTDGGLTPDINAILEVGGEITGTVTAEDTGLPLENVSIYAYTLDGDYVSSGYTDSSGKYSIKQLGPGSYTIQFIQYGSDASYISQWYNNQPDQDSADPVAVTPPDVTPDIDAVLQKGGGITGVVTAEGSGDPLQNINVILHNPAGDYLTSTSVDASGLYTFTMLASGVYYVQFNPYGDSEQYLGEYYDNQTDLLSADPVTVTAPAVVSGIDASLTLGAVITGRVTGSDTSLGLPDVSVNVYDCYGFYAGSAMTDATGYYTTTGLIAGGYRIRFAPSSWGDSRGYLREYYNDKSNLDDANVVTVAAGATKPGIDAVLARGGQIIGTITAADGGAPLDDVDIEIYTDEGYYNSYTSTDASGVYTTTGLASGSYMMYVTPWFTGASKEYAQEYYNNRTNRDDADLIQVTQPNMVPGIDVQLTRGGSISGRVTAAGSATGLEYIYVDLDGIESDFWLYSETDSAGNYTVYGVPSGSFKIDFYPYGDSRDYAFEYYDDQPYWDQATPVTVTAPAALTGIDAELALGGKIECNVKAEDTNTPLEGAYTEAHDSQGYYRASDYTDADGNCVLRGLPSENYKVYFGSYSINTYEACIITTTYYAEEYYDDQPDYDSADPITVLAPNTVTGINALLSIGAPPANEGRLFMPLIVR